VTTLGSPVVMAILTVVVAAVLARRRWWILLVAWLAANAGGGVLDLALKHVIHRARPTGADAFLYGSSFSFPSGHAMGSLIGYGMLVYLLITNWTWARRHRTGIVVTTALLVLAIGLSRLYLGVHFLSDVIGGFAAGAVWLAVCITGAELALRQRGLAPWDVGIERRKTPRPAVAGGPG
jgi:undecaprenyl-diphosphatase